jgi:hypothetical protein
MMEPQVIRSDNQQRRVWHSLVDSAIDAAIINHRPLHAEKLLDSVGLFSWTTNRPAALIYANKQLCAHTKARKGKP